MTSTRITKPKNRDRTYRGLLVLAPIGLVIFALRCGGGEPDTPTSSSSSTAKDLGYIPAAALDRALRPAAGAFASSPISPPAFPTPRY